MADRPRIVISDWSEIGYNPKCRHIPTTHCDLCARDCSLHYFVWTDRPLPTERRVRCPACFAVHEEP